MSSQYSLLFHKWIWNLYSVNIICWGLHVIPMEGGLHVCCTQILVKVWREVCMEIASNASEKGLAWGINAKPHGRNVCMGLHAIPFGKGFAWDCIEIPVEGTCLTVKTQINFQGNGKYYNSCLQCLYACRSLRREAYMGNACTQPPFKAWGLDITSMQIFFFS